MERFKKCRLLKTIYMAFAAVGLQSAAHAVEIGDRVEIHGYGHQGYLQTNDNTYLGADSNGTWDFNSLALAFTGKIDDKATIWSQLHATSKETRLDWMFLDYQVNNNLVARVGQIKLPLGLYNEISDVKFLHLATLAPALYSEAAEIAHEAYRGAAVNYTHDAGGGSLSWETYGGEVAKFHAAGAVKNRRLLGGRVTYKTPLEGLRFMASAYRNKQEDTLTATTGTSRAWLLSGDYTNNNWDLKAEYASVNHGLEGTKAKSYYTQAGYTFMEKWTPYVRFDYITTDKTQRSDPSFYQKTITLGVGYKLNNSVSLRLENHWNRGYALPVAAAEVAAGIGKPDWNMLAASVQFIF